AAVDLAPDLTREGDARRGVGLRRLDERRVARIGRRRGSQSLPVRLRARAQRFELALLTGEDRLDLRLLIGRQIQLVQHEAHRSEAAFSVVPMALAGSGGVR